MDRITTKDLEILTNRINKQTDSPIQAWTRNTELKMKASVGHYYIAGAYGGVKLERMCNESGGCTDISTQGFGTKKELYHWMQAFLAGLTTKTNKVA